jgi:integrase
MRIPKCSRHKGSGQAYVTDPHTRREVYLGKWGTPQAERAYREWVAAFAARNPTPRARKGTPEALTVAGLLDAYLEHCQATYRKHGHETSEVGIVRQAASVLLDLCPRRAAAEFRAPDLEAARDEMVRRDMARSTVNKLVGRLRRCWLWGSKQGLVPRGLWHELCEVRPLRRGQAGVREAPPVLPVRWEVVEATLPFVSALFRPAVVIQYHAAMRPGEVVTLRPRDVDRSREPWCFLPYTHKKEHEGRTRLIWLGPRAREALLPLLERAGPGDWLFPGRRGTHALEASYRNAVARAWQLAGVEGWAPSRLRHSGATLIRRECGLDAAQGVLGHADAATTQKYASLNEDAAREAAERLG